MGSILGTDAQHMMAKDAMPQPQGLADVIDYLRNVRNMANDIEAETAKQYEIHNGYSYSSPDKLLNSTSPAREAIAGNVPILVSLVRETEASLLNIARMQNGIR